MMKRAVENRMKVGVVLVVVGVLRRVETARVRGIMTRVGEPHHETLVECTKGLVGEIQVPRAVVTLVQIREKLLGVVTARKLILINSKCRGLQNHGTTHQREGWEGVMVEHQTQSHQIIRG